MVEKNKIDEQREKVIGKLERKRKSFDEKLEAVLSYLGFATMAVSIIMYGIVVWIYVRGFEVLINPQENIVFAITSALFSVLLTSGALAQGILFAKRTEEAKKVREELKELKHKSTDDIYGIKLYSVIETIKNVIFKGGGILLGMFLIVDQGLLGVNDPTYFVLMVANIFLAIGLSSKVMLNSYNHYIENEIPLLKREIENIKMEEIENEKKGEGGDEYVIFETNERTSNETIRRSDGRGISERDSSPEGPGGTSEPGIRETGGESPAVERGLC